MRSTRIRYFTRLGLGGIALLFSLGYQQRAARAQAFDVSNPSPNVLILLDTSGSMEKMIDGQDPELNASGGPSACSPGAPTIPNRWGAAVQALSGDVSPYYSCVSMPRTANAPFDLEYRINGQAPYDLNYHMPFHRPVSGSSPSTACTYGPAGLPGASGSNGVGTPPVGLGGSATDFPANAIGTFLVNPIMGSSGSINHSACQFTQLNNGFVDQGRDLLRFGLMTFDTDPGYGTGVTSSMDVLTPPSSASAGLWSYFPNWQNLAAANATVGSPANCTTLVPDGRLGQYMEVGARNPAAPPWEGRLIKFPGSTANLLMTRANNDLVKLAINAARPYGATPIAGMLEDAKTFFWWDPAGPEQTDAYVNPNAPGGSGSGGSCRDEYIVLLTDGAPNLDLRPACTATGTPNGQCPYKSPEVIADDLYRGVDTVRNLNGHKVTTFVIGFAVSGTGSLASTFPGGHTSCSSFRSDTAYFATACTDPNLVPDGSAAEACCTLEKIARFGSGNQYGAFFADNATSLRQAFSTILANIASTVTSRATPSYTPPSMGNSGGQVDAFTTVFKPNAAGVWQGNVQRRRTYCSSSTFTSVTDPVTVSRGDDFASNLNTGTGTNRRFLAIQPATSLPGGKLDSENSIRPYAPTANQDGAGTYAGQEVGGVPSTILGGISPAALAINSNTCSAGQGRAALNAADCARLALSFTMAQDPNLASQGYSFAPPITDRLTNRFGGVFHASPIIVPPPSAFLRDDSYIAFRNIPAYAQRKTVVYVATTDGLLHAFDNSVSLNTNNEMWSFMPPAIMPMYLSNYPSGQNNILDGTPVAKDVVFERRLSTVGAWNTSWRTVLVAGMGSYGGYYALDVTQPDVSAWVPPSPTPSTPPPPNGPHMLWQLTTVADVAPNTGVTVRSDQAGTVQKALFGRFTGTPAITTIYADPDGTGARELGVAILPGGVDGPPRGQGGYCYRARNASSGSGYSFPPPSNATYADYLPLSGHTPRDMVKKWGTTCTAPVAGRSVSIVRLDTGEILRHFSRDQTGYVREAPAALVNANRVTNTPLDSPMIGTPVVFPAETGAVAQKFFVADADGAVWKFDISNPNPAQWRAGMFYDAFSKEVMSLDNSITNATELAEYGQPIQVPPTVSLDDAGNLVVHIATGDLENFYARTFRSSDLDPNDPSDADDELNKVPIYNYLHAVIEKADPSGVMRANETWRLPFRNGERVAGPMVVWGGTLYLSTWAPPAGSISCVGGEARLYGMLFTTPDTETPCSIGGPYYCGGRRILQPPPPATPLNPAPSFIVPGLYDNTIAGKLIPGVSVRNQPACANTSTAYTDQYIGGTTYTPSNVQSGAFFLSVTVGAPNASGGVKTFEQTLETPKATTRVDSWASVIE